jgi:hypothetical protein
MHVNNACMFYAQYASIVVWKSQNGAETLVNLGARKKLTCFDPLRKGCGDFFYFFCSQLLVQHTIPTTLNSHKNNFNEIILFQNSPVQPLSIESILNILFLEKSVLPKEQELIPEY